MSKAIILILLLSIVSITFGRIIGPWTQDIEKRASDRYYVHHWEKQMKSLLFQNERVESLLLWKEMIRWPDSLQNNQISINPGQSRILYQWPEEDSVAVHVVVNNERLHRYDFDSGDWSSQSIAAVRDQCYRGQVVSNMGVKKVGNVLYFVGGLTKQNGGTVLCGWDLLDKVVSVDESFDYGGVTQNIGLQNHWKDGKLFIFFGRARFVHEAVLFDIESREFTEEIYSLGNIPDGSSISVTGSIYAPLEQLIYALSSQGNLYEVFLENTYVTFESNLGKSKLFPIDHNLIFATLSVDSLKISFEDLDHLQLPLLEVPIKDISLVDFEIVHHPKANMFILKANGDEEAVENLPGNNFVQFNGRVLTHDERNIYVWNGARFQKHAELTEDFEMKKGFMTSDGSNVYVYDGYLWKYNEEDPTFDKVSLTPPLPQISHSAGCIVDENLYIVGGFDGEGGFSNQCVKFDLRMYVHEDCASSPKLVGMEVVNFNRNPLVIGGYDESAKLNPIIYDIKNGEEVFFHFNSSIGHTAAVVVDEKIFAINSHGAHILKLSGDSTSYEVKPFKRIPRHLYARINYENYVGKFSLIHQNEKLLIFFSQNETTVAYESTLENPDDWTPLQSDEPVFPSSSTGLDNRLYGVSGDALVYFDTDRKILSSFIAPPSFTPRKDAAVCSSPDRSSIFVQGGKDINNGPIYDLWEVNPYNGTWKRYPQEFEFSYHSIAYLDGKVHMFGNDFLTYHLESNIREDFSIAETQHDVGNIFPFQGMIISSSAISGGLDYHYLQNSQWESVVAGDAEPEAGLPIMFSYNGTLYAFKSGEEGKLYQFMDEQWYQTNISFPEISFTRPIIRGNSLIAYPYEIDLVSHHVVVLETPYDNGEMELVKVGRKVYFFIPQANRIWDYDLDTLQWGFVFISEKLTSSFSVVAYGERYIYILHENNANLHRKWRIGSSELRNDVPIDDVVLTAFSHPTEEAFIYFTSNEFRKFHNGAQSAYASDLQSVSRFFSWKNQVVVETDMSLYRCEFSMDAIYNCAAHINLLAHAGYMIYGNVTYAFFYDSQVLYVLDDSALEQEFSVRLGLHLPHYVQIDDHSMMMVGVKDTKFHVVIYNAALQELVYPSNARWISDNIAHGVWEARPTYYSECT